MSDLDVPHFHHEIVYEVMKSEICALIYIVKKIVCNIRIDLENIVCNIRIYLENIVCNIKIDSMQCKNLHS